MKFKVDANLPRQASEAQQQDKETVIQVLTRVCLLLESEPLAGLLWIVEADKVRVRPRAAGL